MKYKKFKYMVEYYNANYSVLFYDNKMFAEMNRLGEYGWQVVSVVLNGDIKEVLYMKEYYDE